MTLIDYTDVIRYLERVQTSFSVVKENTVRKANQENTVITANQKLTRNQCRANQSSTGIQEKD